jgi:hypothetical protein
MPDMLMMSLMLDLAGVLTAIRTIIWSHSNIDQDWQQQAAPLELKNKKFNVDRIKDQTIKDEYRAIQAQQLEDQSP